MAQPVPLALDIRRRDGGITLYRFAPDARLPALDVAALLSGLEGPSLEECRQQFVVVGTALVRRARLIEALSQRWPVLIFARYSSAMRQVQLGLGVVLALIAAVAVLPPGRQSPGHACDHGALCWAVDSFGLAYALLAVALLVVEGALLALSASAKSSGMQAAPQLGAVRQLVLLTIALAALALHPYLLVLLALDAVPALPGCRALLDPLRERLAAVAALAALAAAALVAAAAVGATLPASGGCGGGGSVAACGVEALILGLPAAIASPLLAASLPQPTAASALSLFALPPSPAPPGEAAPPPEHAGGWLGAPLLLLLLGVGVLLLQAGLALVVEALAAPQPSPKKRWNKQPCPAHPHGAHAARQRAGACAASDRAQRRARLPPPQAQRARREAAARGLASSCLVCGLSRRVLRRHHAQGFERHVGGVHHPASYLQLLGHALEVLEPFPPYAERGSKPRLAADRGDCCAPLTAFGRRIGTGRALRPSTCRCPSCGARWRRGSPTASAVAPRTSSRTARSAPRPPQPAPTPALSSRATAGTATASGSSSCCSAGTGAPPARSPSTSTSWATRSSTRAPPPAPRLAQRHPARRTSVPTVPTLAAEEEEEGWESAALRQAWANPSAPAAGRHRRRRRRPACGRRARRRHLVRLRAPARARR